MSDYKKKLEELQERIQARKLEKAKLEERKEALEKEQAKILAQLKEQGISSLEELEEEIKKRETIIVDFLEKIEKILN